MRIEKYSTSTTKQVYWRKRGEWENAAPGPRRCRPESQLSEVKLSEVEN